MTQPETFMPNAAWPVAWSCDVSQEAPVVTGKAVAFASNVLWSLTGRQFGMTTVTYRPCRDVVYDTPYPDAWLSWPGTQAQPYNAIGTGGSGGYYGPYWMLAGCGTCEGGCSCVGLSQVTLPAPVSSMTEVKIDGQVLDPTAYRVDDNRYLVRVDGVAWPNRNDLRFDDTAVGTWSVTATYGLGLPPGADWAVGELACELIKAFHGEDCRLPRHVTQLARQGVTITVPDLNQLFKDGQTGLYLADIFINTYNPNHLTTRARTYNVDRVREHHRVGT